MPSLIEKLASYVVPGERPWTRVVEDLDTTSTRLPPSSGESVKTYTLAVGTGAAVSTAEEGPTASLCLKTIAGGDGLKLLNGGDGRGGGGSSCWAGGDGSLHAAGTAYYTIQADGLCICTLHSSSMPCLRVLLARRDHG